MQSTALPTLIPIPFAATGGKNVIPNTTNPIAGGADFPNGFPSLTRTPLAAGGIPPAGLDMNGILNAITAVQQWQCAGGYFKYDSAFSASIGGYPKYAELVGATGIVYVNQVENNTTNPESGGTNWGSLQTVTPTAGDRTNKVATTAMFASEFVGVQGVSGYQRFPNGTVMQWGTSLTIEQGASATVSFNVPFLVAVYNVSVSLTGQSVSTSSPFSPGSGTPTLTGFTIFNNGTNGVMQVSFIAIGK